MRWQASEHAGEKRHPVIVQQLDMEWPQRQPDVDRVAALVAPERFRRDADDGTGGATGAHDVPQR
jgi:hypothetical protein